MSATRGLLLVRGSVCNLAVGAGCSRDLALGGWASGASECAYVRDELGFDQVINHRAPDFAEQLTAACPNGIESDLLCVRFFTTLLASRRGSRMFQTLSSRGTAW